MSDSATRPLLLLVEDDAAVRDVIARFLTAHGYEVVSAESAEQALALARARSMDMLVSDIVLRGLDGFNMAAEIARWSPRTSMHFMSGQCDASMAIAAGWAADTPVLRKPFALLDLLRLLRESSRSPAGLPEDKEESVLGTPSAR